MFLHTKTTTEVNVTMDGTNLIDTFEVSASAEVMEGWAMLMSRWGAENKVAAIKHFRSQFGCGLRLAKAFVDDAMRNY